MNIFDQEGNTVTMNQIQQEFVNKFRDILNEKLSEFEEALSDRCKEEDLPYANIGFQPNVGSVCYQVGMGIYTIKVNPSGLQPVMVGSLQ